MVTKKLEGDHYDVIVPDFPKSDHPILAEWIEFFDQYHKLLNEKTIFIGHSLGGAFALRLLEHIQKPIHATFLVASVAGVMGNKLDPLVTTFTTPLYDWNVIRQNSKYFSIIHSDNDPYISLSQATQLATALNTKLTMIENGGHFNTGSGFQEFPFLHSKIIEAAK